jgi:hypothetical protein
MANHPEPTMINQPLTRATLAAHLYAYLDTLLPLQRIDSAHPERGGIVNPQADMADPKMTELFILCAGYADLTGGELAPAVQDHVLQAADFLLHAQRPSGLLDLLSVNYDSSPDTGFTVQALCALIEAARLHKANTPWWEQLLGRVERFLRRAVPGMLTGGFHTPNHRWVMASALAQACALFPDMSVAATVDAYLAEGFDIDDEGEFIERSAAIYDAVCDRSLLFLAECWDAAGALDAVQRNLRFNLDLLHGDGTIDTGLSRRQDYGARPVPAGLIDSYLRSHHHQPNPAFVNAAWALWEQFPAHDPALPWLCYAVLKYGEPPTVNTDLPDNFSRHYPHNGIWRIRRGRLSASVYQQTTRLLTLVSGCAELCSVRISQTYFGQYIGRFAGDAMHVDGDTCVLRSEGRSNPRRPGYELPLGRPVPHDRWDEALKDRSIRRLPPALSTLAVRALPDGLELRYTTLDGLERVAAQIAFDFPAGGIWETADCRMQPAAGQVIFLKHGAGEMRYGNDAIRIVSGAYAHGMWAMRDAETAPDCVRVLLTFLTPVDAVIKLVAYRGLRSDTVDAV